MAKFDDLNKEFDIEPSEIEVIEEKVDAEIEQKDEVIKSKGTDDISKDYEYTRGNLYSIIEKGQEELSMVF